MGEPAPLPTLKEKLQVQAEQEEQEEQEEEQEEDNKVKNKEEKETSTMIVVPGGAWFELDIEEIESEETPSSQLIKQKFEQAKKLWEKDALEFERKRESNSKANKDFMHTVLKNGTVTDKVSALTLLVQESPLHSFNYFNEHMVNGMAKKKARREAMLAIDSIKDLLINNILPDRKLSYFVDQPVHDKRVTPAHLITWYFEDALKKSYFQFIQLVEELSKDVLEHVKTKMLTIVYDLLVAKPEQEANLLTLLVNKMGDLDKKVASKSAFLLNQLLIKHPAMKAIVIKEVERLLYRPNIGERACYYAVTFLNQIVLSHGENDRIAANHLIQLYFTLFDSTVKKLSTKQQEPQVTKKTVKKKGKKAHYKKHVHSKKNETLEPRMVEMDAVNSKLMAAILTGVNRAFPFSNLEQQVFEKHINTLFTISHISHFNTSIQAMTLIFQVQTTRNQMVSDRFYRTIYEMLFDGRLYQASKQAMFLNLLFKALKADDSIERVQSFVKRLLQCVSLAQVPVVCGSLFLISELLEKHTGVISMLTQPEEEDEEKYDGRKRDPLYAHANKSCLWELAPFANHFHPTISLYAKTLLSGKRIEVPENATNYDPMQNHTLSRFLDRFVFKAPKKVKSVYQGSSLMQPRAINSKQKETLVSGGRKKRNVIVAGEETLETEVLDDTPVNDPSWRTKSESSIPVDEVRLIHLAILLSLL